jgi:hypothetical protein
MWSLYLCLEIHNMGLKLLRYDSDAMPVINMIIFQFFITAFLCVYYNVFCVLIVVAPKKINHIE